MRTLNAAGSASCVAEATCVGHRSISEEGLAVSGSQKALKIISILLIAWAVLTILFGAFLAAGSAVPGMSGESIDVGGDSVDMAATALALGMGVIVGGVVDLIVALFGLRGAKNPRKAGVFFVLCVIGLMLGIDRKSVV